MEDLLTTKEAAEYLGVSMARIRQLIGAAQVCAQRNGKSWLVERASLDAYAATATPGRPATGSTRARVKQVGKSPVSYVLMNRGHQVARCVYDPLERCFTQVEIIDEDRVPLALCTYQAKHSLRKALNQWWGSRGIPSSRWNFKARLRELEVKSAFELPFRSLGLSLSDQYWLRPEGSDLAWEDVNYLRNSFDMGPLKSDGSVRSSAGPWMNAVGLDSPDNTTDGMLNKRWILDGEGQRLLIKGNGPSGREAYNEVIATKLYRRLLPSWRYVEYQLRSWRGNDVSACASFLRDDEEFIPAWYVFKLKKKSNSHSDFRHYCETCMDLGVQGVVNQLSRMLVCDSILANTDRHWGNFGIIRNIETLEYRVAPIFDTGTSLWSHTPVRDLVNGDYTFTTKPFKKIPGKQLELVIDASWFHPEALEGFEEEVREYLNSVTAGTGPTEAICKGLRARIDAVCSWSRQAPLKPFDSDQAELSETLEWVWL